MREILRKLAELLRQPWQPVDIVFTNRPHGPEEPAIFVEAEQGGKSVALPWIDQADGTAVLRIPRCLLWPRGRHDRR